MSKKFGTGQTIQDIVLSVNNENEPVTGATFTTTVYKSGVIDTGTTINMVLSDPSTGAFYSSWTASTVGDYQVLYKNDSTNVLYITDVYNVVADEFLSTNVFVGL